MVPSASSFQWRVSWTTVPPPATHLGLASDLVGDGVLQRPQRVHVLHLGAGPVAGRPDGTDRHVGVESHRPGLQPGIGHSQPADHPLQFGGIGPRLLRAAQVGLGHHLDQRHPGAVEVDQRAGGVVDAPPLGAVQALPGVLLHVDPGDPDPADHPFDVDIEVPVDAQRDVVLRDLVVLRQVRIEVVLAVEHRVLHQLTARGRRRCGGFPRSPGGWAPEAPRAVPGTPGTPPSSARPRTSPGSRRTSSTGSTARRGSRCR